MKWSLRGFPTFSLWYGPKVREDLAVNSIIVETRRGQSAAGVPQCLAYMGMVHTQRRYEGKVNHPIFGLATDNEEFHFLVISGEGNVSKPPALAYITRKMHVLTILLVVPARHEPLRPYSGDC